MRAAVLKRIGDDTLEGTVTHRGGLEDVNRALAGMAAGTGGHIRTVLSLTPA